jgi:hypothetical protein
MGAMHIFDMCALMLLLAVVRRRIYKNVLFISLLWFCLHPDDEV